MIVSIQGTLPKNTQYFDSPLPFELKRLMHGTGGRLDISTTALLHLLNKNALDESKADSHWPKELYELGIALTRIREHAAQLGIRVQYRGKKTSHGRRWRITKTEA